MNIQNNEPEARYFLPDFCQLQSLFLLVLTAELLAIIFTLIISTQPSWMLLGLISMLCQWIVLVSSGLICVFKSYIEHWKVWQIGMVSYFFILLSTMICTLVGIWFYFYQANFNHFGSMTAIQWKMVQHNLAIASILGGILLRYFYLQQQYRIRLAAETQAKVEALHARIHPHFLFNTLNSVAALIPTSPQQAEVAIENLAKLMRATLKDMRVMVPWKKEIQLCKNYLELEKLRLGDRLQIKIEIDDVDENFLLPGLILQPLIENAILHGVSRMTEGGLLDFSAQQNEEGLQISIKNPVPDNKSPKRQGHGIGLDNVQQRLEIIYLQSAKMKVIKEEEFFQINLWIPEIKS